MKYITFVVPPVEYESEDETDSSNELTREAEVTYNLNLSDDGATIELTYLRGGPARIRTVLETNPRVLTYDVVAGQSGRGAYIHSRANELVSDVLSLLVHHQIIVEWLLEYTDRGGHRVTVLGKDEQIRQMTTELTNTDRIIIEGIGDH